MKWRRRTLERHSRKEKIDSAQCAVRPDESQNYVRVIGKLIKLKKFDAASSRAYYERIIHQECNSYGKAPWKIHKTCVRGIGCTISCRAILHIQRPISEIKTI